MALKIDTQYPGRTIGGDTDYPQGSWKNVSSPGGTDGTPYEKAWPNDVFGLLQRLLDQAQIVPSGAADTVPLSDYMSSLQRIFPLWLTYLVGGTADALQLSPISGSTVPAYADGMMIVFRPLESNTSAATVQIGALPVRPLTFSNGDPLDPGVVAAQIYQTAVYNLTAARFELLGVAPSARLTTISGGVLRNSGADVVNDIIFGAGVFPAANTAETMILTGDLLKKTDLPWAVGNEMGGMFSSSVRAPDTWYHCFVIKEDATGIIDAGFSENVAATDIPPGWTAYRRVFSIYIDTAGEIEQFLAHEISGGSLDVEWRNIILDVTGTAGNLTGLRVIRQITVPPDILPIAKITASLNVPPSPTTLFVLIGSLYKNDVSPTVANMSLYIVGGTPDAGCHIRVLPTADREIAIRSQLNVNAGGGFNLSTTGFIDRRV